MSQIILDEHLGVREVLTPLQRWITVRKIEDFIPADILKDQRVLQLLGQLKQPTFVTLDAGFCHRRYRDRRYCLLYFVLPQAEQRRLPDLLRRLFRLPEFKSRTVRMGKVARVNHERVEFWQVGEDKQRILRWLASPRR